MLGVVGSSLKMVKFEQTTLNNVAMYCVRSFGRGVNHLRVTVKTGTPNFNIEHILAQDFCKALDSQEIHRSTVVCKFAQSHVLPSLESYYQIRPNFVVDLLFRSQKKRDL